MNTSFETLSLSDASSSRGRLRQENWREQFNLAAPALFRRYGDFAADRKFLGAVLRPLRSLGTSRAFTVCPDTRSLIVELLALLLGLVGFHNRQSPTEAKAKWTEIFSLRSVK